MNRVVSVACDVVQSARVKQVSGIFDVPVTEKSRRSWNVTLPLDERPWRIGLIVGPSGCGKSTVARAMFGDSIMREFAWSDRRSILDDFPKELSTSEIVTMLSSVGFSSPPSWLRPHNVLSNGEKFRADMARMLAEPGELVVVDEFTSVVDRTVAQIGSHALAKAIRRSESKRFIAVTCHEDVEDWLQPDWVYRPAEQRFAWRSLQRRPDITLEINRVHHSAWRLFAHHHYLTAELNKAAYCFVAFWNGVPVAFDAWLPFVGRLKAGSASARRGHRTVCLPDYQGVGIGGALFCHVASMWKGLGYRAFSGTSHPAEIRNRKKSGLWKMTAAPRRTARDGGSLRTNARSTHRLMASFEYIGPAMDRRRAQALLETRARVGGR